MALLIKTDGTKEQVKPKGRKFTLEEMYAYCGSPIDYAFMPNGSCFVVNDCGKLTGLPVNEEASRIWREAYPIELYPYNNVGSIAGDVLLLTPEEATDEEEETDIGSKIEDANIVRKARGVGMSTGQV